MSPTIALPFDPVQLVTNRFAAASVPTAAIDVREYPEETILIVRVSPDLLVSARDLANELDRELQSAGFRGFVTVRPSEEDSMAAAAGPMDRGVTDARATVFVNLLAERSRTSEIQPSLSYIQDAAQNIVTALTPRHHLIFGRRGAGKTALMVEARRRVESSGHLTSWTNVQSLRGSKPGKAFCWIAKDVLDSVAVALRMSGNSSAAVSSVAELRGVLETLVRAPKVTMDEAQTLVPQVQQAIARSLATLGTRIYVFLDDLQYFERTSQPALLDLTHSALRDTDGWLKISAIKHLCRWFQTNPPTGLQTGHDADHIELDLTLENPSKAKEFLEAVLKTYARHSAISSLSTLFSGEALDRLVLASGAVPRDYLVLSAESVRQAQRREKSRTVGVQDVNKAAGAAAKVKLTELEDDAAAIGGRTQMILDALQTIRAFCLDERRCTYFRVDFHEKEVRPREYELLQSLMDLRLVHLVNSGVSDEREAGRKSEVFMLDLSQFSGERLKKHLKVLDFAGKHLVVKETGTAAPMKTGDSPRKLLGLLRRGPAFALSSLTEATRSQIEQPSLS